MWRHPLRVSGRLLGFLALSLAALADHGRLICLGRSLDAPLRAHWTHRWGRRFLRLLGVDLRIIGTPPQGGVLAANHLGYLDIVALAATQPMAFVSKHEVRQWPLIGWLTRCAGTIFIDRARKLDPVELTPACAEVVEAGVVLGFFPEGTSTDGRRVLTFHPALFEPASQRNWTVTPAWIGYAVSEGSVEDEVCYWRDMTFATHFLNLLGKERIEAVIAFGEPVPAGLNRKEIARRCRAEVVRLAGLHAFPPAPVAEAMPEPLLQPASLQAQGFAARSAT